MAIIVKYWARFTFWTTGSKIKVFGEHNIPQNENVAFVGNHQSSMDIPIMLGYTNVHAAFLAKKELQRVLILSQWMQLIGCVFIDRKSVRNSFTAFAETIDNIKTSHSMIIFPEGTRSKSNKMNLFKEGILHLLIKEQITIIPFTLINSHKTFEEHNKIRKAKVELLFHPAVSTKTIQEGQIKEKIHEIWSIVNSPFIHP